MRTTSIPSDRKSARVALVREHVRLENEHHLEGVLSTFGENAQYQDEAWGDRYTGHDGVRLYYEQLMAALPDLEIKILQEHVTEDNVLLEVLICGTPLGPWRGLPATGRRVQIPLCGIYTFDDQDRLAKGFTTTEPASYDSSVCFVNRKRLWGKSDFYSTIP